MLLHDQKWGFRCAPTVRPTHAALANRPFRIFFRDLLVLLDCEVMRIVTIEYSIQLYSVPLMGLRRNPEHFRKKVEHGLP